MKTVFLCLMLVLGQAHAANWIMVDETDDGIRMLVDVDTWRLTKQSENDDDITAAAMFRFVTSDGKLQKPFAYVNYVKSCASGNGELFMRDYDGTSWSTTTKHWWSRGGSKLYDRAGAALCDIFKVRLEAHRKSENSEKQKEKQPEKAPQQKSGKEINI
jgi:hypothetical protein